jgi:hypothetical protein
MTNQIVWCIEDFLLSIYGCLASELCAFPYPSSKLNKVLFPFRSLGTECLLSRVAMQLRH